MSSKAQRPSDGWGHRNQEGPARPIVLGIVAFAALVLAAIWATVLFLAHRERDAVFASARAELIGAQATLAAHVGRTFESALAIQSSVDHWLGEHSTETPPTDLSNLDTYVHRLQRHHERPVLIRLVDRDGRLAYPRLPDAQIVDFKDREHFQGIRKKPAGSIHIGAPVASRINDQRMIPIMMSAHPNAYGVHYILVGIPVAPIEDAYRDLLITAPGIYGILREDGMVLLRAPDREALTGTVHPRLSFDKLFASATAPAPAQGIMEFSGAPMADPQIVAFRRLDPLPLATYAAFDLDQVATKARGKALLPLGVAAFGTLVTLAITLWLGAMAIQREREARRLHDALADARQASRAKTDFLANMSHELRTPLNAVLGMSEMIDGAHLGPLPAKYRDYARDIGRSGRHLLGLIEQILSIAQVERGAMRPARSLVDLRAALVEMEPILTPRLAEARMRYAVELPADLPLLDIDPRMLHQMLLCLLVNATRYAGPGAAVTVSATAEPGGLTLTVTDTGPGIPPETLGHVFEPFGRNNSTVARPEGGLGLGLPTVKSLVELHDGRIDIATAEGRGTAVTLTFPATAIAQPPSVKRLA